MNMHWFVKKIKKNMIQQTVTIGLVYDKNVKDINNTIYSILAQNYKIIELIISFNSRDAVSIADLISSINMYRNINLRNIELNVNGDAIGMAGNINYIVERASGEYITFINAEDSYCDNSVISNFVSDLTQNNLKASISKTAVFNTINNSWAVFGGNSSLDLPSSSITSLSIFYKSELIKNRKVWGSDIFEIQSDYLKNIGKEQISYSDFWGIRHQYSSTVSLSSLAESYSKPENGLIQDFNFPEQYLKAKINYSSFLKFKAILNRCIEQSGQEKQEKNKEKINSEIEFILKRKDGCWRIASSDYVYIQYLEKLKSLLNRNFSTTELISLLHEAENRSNSSYKIAFFTNEFEVWPSLKSVYEFALKDIRYDPQLIYVPFTHEYSNFDHKKEIDKYKNAGYNIIKHNNYYLSEESPDIVIYVKPFDSIPESFQIKEIDKVVRRCIYIPYGMETANNKECLNYQCYCPLQFIAWKVLAYCPEYYEKVKKNSYSHAKNYIKIGHPRFDLRFEDMSDNPYNKIIEKKARHRKIVLWNTHFTLEGDDTWGTYLIYGNDVIDYFKKNMDLFLLWRPHPMFYSALAKVNNIGLTEVEDYIKELESWDNILVDRFPNYLPAFAASDALLTDQTSFIPEYVVRNKSMLITKKTETPIPLFGDLKGILHYAKNKSDIVSFLDGILYGNNKNINNTLFEKMYVPEIGTVAQKLLDYIDQEINNECRF